MMQPFVKEDGIVRFKANGIVRYLLDNGGIDLNHLDEMGDEFTQADWEQFFQLIGYSLKGYHELNKVSDESALQATQNARIQFKESKIGGCRDDGCELHCGVKADSIPLPS